MNKGTLPKSTLVGKERWKLVWSDTFTYEGHPDDTKWGYDIGGHGFGNKELQFYTDRRLKNARVQSGRLILEAHQEKWENCYYTSAKLTTKGRAAWQYAKIIVRAKLPVGEGSWPAIWMMPEKPDAKWPEDGEIDIVEHIELNRTILYCCLQTEEYNHLKGTQLASYTKLYDIHTTFHEYSIVWKPEEITLFVDNRIWLQYHQDQQNEASWPFDQPFHLNLNIAIIPKGTEEENLNRTIFPKRMEIAYVGVYQPI